MAFLSPSAPGAGRPEDFQLLASPAGWAPSPLQGAGIKEGRLSFDVLLEQEGPEDAAPPGVLEAMGAPPAAATIKSE